MGKPQGLECGLPESLETLTTLLLSMPFSGMWWKTQSLPPSVLERLISDLRGMSEQGRGSILCLATGISSPSEENCLNPGKVSLSFIYLLPSVSTHPGITGTKMFSTEDKARMGTVILSAVSTQWFCCEARDLDR